MTQPLVTNGAARVTSQLTRLSPAGRGAGASAGAGARGARAPANVRSNKIWLRNERNRVNQVNEYIPSGGRGQGTRVHPLLRGTLESRLQPAPSLQSFSRNGASAPRGSGSARGGAGGAPPPLAPPRQAPGAGARAHRRAARRSGRPAPGERGSGSGGGVRGYDDSAKNPFDLLKLSENAHTRDSNAEGVAWLADDIRELAVEAFRAAAHDAAQAAKAQAAKFKPAQAANLQSKDNLANIVKEIPTDHWAKPYMHAVSRALDRNADANHHQKLAIINDTISALRTPNRFPDSAPTPASAR